MVRFCGYSWKISGFAQGARPEFWWYQFRSVFGAFFKLFKPWSFGFPNHEVFILNYHFSWFWNPQKYGRNIEIIVVYVQFFGQIDHPGVGKYRYLNIPLPWNLMILWDMKHVKKAAEVSTLRMGASELFRLDNCLAGALIGGQLGHWWQHVVEPMVARLKRQSMVACLIHPGRWTAGTYSHHPFNRKEHDHLPSSSREVWSRRENLPGCNDHNSVIWDNYIGIHQLYRLWGCSELPICDLENSANGTVCLFRECICIFHIIWFFVYLCIYIYMHMYNLCI